MATALAGYATAAPALWGDVAGWQIALGIGIALSILCALSCWLWPALLIRPIFWLLTRGRLLYRLHAIGRRNVPRHGGALLVCNRLGPLDWLLLVATLRRPVRHLLLAPWARHSWPARMAGWAGAITVGGEGKVRDVARAIRKARDALAAGELVCLLVENYRSRDGFPLPFHRVFRQVARRLACPIVPVCVDQMRGSLFLLEQGRPVWRRPMYRPHPVDVCFASPLPPDTRAADVCQAQHLVSAQAAVARASRRQPIHRGFVRMAGHHPFRPCFIDSSQPGRDLTYARALAVVLVLRKRLGRLLGDDRIVGVWLPPSTGGALVNITLAVLGKTSANLNYTSSPETVRSALRQCDARHVITARRFVGRMPFPGADGIEVIYLDDILPQIGRWEKLRAFLTALLVPGWALEHWVLRLGKHRLEDLATIIFSSGSTGDPKGVMLSHGNVAANIESMVQAIDLSPRDRLLGVLPFFHSFGYTVTLWAPLQVGAAAVYHPDPRQAKEIGELCRKERCTLYLSTATFLRFCLRRCEADDFRSLRVLICGAEKLPQSLAEQFQDKFSLLPLEGYGCTELSPVVAANLPDVEVDGMRIEHNRPGTVGPSLPGIACRTVHPETFVPLPLGEEGLLLVRGANVMQGYLHRPEQTAAALRDGWYVTGDMARIDDDGRVTLTGRLSRFAKCGGEMVPLEMVEEVLHEVLGTTERVCAVTCVPDEARGERIVVLYTAHDGIQVRPWHQRLGARGLPNLWLPAERDFFAVAELPLLGSGKLNLKRVKEMALELARR